MSAENPELPPKKNHLPSEEGGTLNVRDSTKEHVNEALSHDTVRISLMRHYPFVDSESSRKYNAAIKKRNAREELSQEDLAAIASSETLPVIDDLNDERIPENIRAAIGKFFVDEEGTLIICDQTPETVKNEDIDQDKPTNERVRVTTKDMAAKFPKAKAWDGMTSLIHLP